MAGRLFNFDLDKTHPPAGPVHRPGGAGEQSEYILTRKGLELLPAVVALAEWCDKWVRPGPIFFADRADNRPVQIELRRPDTGERIDVADIVAVSR